MIPSLSSMERAAAAAAAAICARRAINSAMRAWYLARALETSAFAAAKSPVALWVVAMTSLNLALYQASVSWVLVASMMASYSPRMSRRARANSLEKAEAKASEPKSMDMRAFTFSSYMLVRKAISSSLVVRRDSSSTRPTTSASPACLAADKSFWRVAIWALSLLISASMEETFLVKKSIWASLSEIIFSNLGTFSLVIKWASYSAV